MKSTSRLLCVASLAALLAACNPPAPPFKATEIGPVDWGRDITLTAHTGKLLDTASLRGKVAVLFFGYTHCPDICAPMLTRLAQAMQQIGPQAAAVQVLFVTVDPKHDTAQQLAGFVPKFHPSFIGLTGSEAETAAAAREFKVMSMSATGAPGEVRFDHFGGLMVKDKTGRLRLLIRGDASAEDIAADLRRLAAE